MYLGSLLLPANPNISLIHYGQFENRLDPEYIFNFFRFDCERTSYRMGCFPYPTDTPAPLKALHSSVRASTR